MSPPALASIFFAQMCVVLLACRIAGVLVARLGQPQVVGDMLAGIVLGPSVFGYFAPAWREALFPPASIGTLHVAAQVGIGLYMVFVGLELDTSTFALRAKTPIAVALASVVLPFAAGAAIAAAYFGRFDLFPADVTPSQAMLFVGAAMSITALPVLARILHERGLEGTRLAAIVLTAAAVGDLVAWSVVAVVLASRGDSSASASRALVGGGVFVALMLTVGKRSLAILGAHVERTRRLSPAISTLVLAVAMGVLFVADALRIHAVFGGFVLGLALPRGTLATELRAKVEHFLVVFLLPIFFVISGVSTRFDVAFGKETLPLALVVVAVACVAKAGSTFVAARLAGEPPRTALGIGVLMNARGLTELVVLNVGLARGVIAPTFFTVMTAMAIVTTVTTTPLASRFARADEPPG